MHLKNLLSIIFLGTLTFMSSCADNIDPLVIVTVERDFQIPGNLNTIETHFFELKAIPVLLNENLSVYNKTEEDIVSISPADAILTSTFNNIDWTFIQRVEVYAVSRFDNNKKLRMFQSNEPDFGNRNQLTMFNTFIDVQEVFKEELIDLEIRIKTRAFVPSNINAKLTFSYGIFDQM